MDPLDPLRLLHAKEEHPMFAHIKVTLFGISLILGLTLATDIGCGGNSSSKGGNTAKILATNSAPTAQATNDSRQLEATPLGPEQEARRTLDEWYHRRMLRCGNWYFMKMTARGPGRFSSRDKYVQFRDITFEFSSIRYPKPLSEVDRLNGVEPGPDTSVKFIVNFETYRESDMGLGQPLHWMTWVPISGAGYYIGLPDLVRKQGDALQVLCLEEWNAWPDGKADEPGPWMESSAFACQEFAGMTP